MKCQLLSLTTVLLGTLAGCGDSSLVTLEGRVVQDGQPVAVQLPNALQVNFHKMKDGKRVNLFPARVNREDGTFEVIGPEKKGIPIGSYHVSVEWVDEWSNDRLKKAFHFDNTPFKYEIDADTPEIVLDIKTPAK